jgi:hypothetical protein
MLDLRFRIVAASGWLSVLAVLAAFVTPAGAVIDMSGVYVAVDFPCRYTFVQTGTSLAVSGPCSTQNAPLNLTGTIDTDTGAFTVSVDAVPVYTPDDQRHG